VALFPLGLQLRDNLELTKQKLDLATIALHNGAVAKGQGTRRVSLAAARWNYAASLSLPDVSQRDVRIAIELRVNSGTCGVGLVGQDGSTFLLERVCLPGQQRIVLRCGGSLAATAIVFRTVDQNDCPLEFEVMEIICEVKPMNSEYFGLVTVRDYAAESEPGSDGAKVFEDDLAQGINRARLAHLASLDLPVNGKRVLDVGCGVGHFSRFYLERGCTWFGIEGRQSNIDVMRRLYPDVDGAVADVQDSSFARRGQYDVVHCFGLLYHLESPIAALRNIRAVCAGFVLLETMVADANMPLMLIVDESKSVNQALAGVGCRPSPAYVTMALNRVGFRHIYLASPGPDHGDFRFEWRNDLSIRRGNNNLRCVFVASDTPMERPGLTELLY
jgi:2-polyprenyl-3-methyl-5-hydroxy-6-metoxy-1,4-benzoquinol methylase